MGEILEQKVSDIADDGGANVAIVGTAASDVPFSYCCCWYSASTVSQGNSYHVMRSIMTLHNRTTTTTASTTTGGNDSGGGGGGDGGGGPTEDRWHCT